MKTLLLAATLVALSVPASAAMPPETYAGPQWDRIVAQARNTVASVKADNYVAPWSRLVPGQYINPTSGAVEGVPSCPPGPMQKFGKPFC